MMDKFYIDEIPKDSCYINPHDFFNNDSMESGLQVVDHRWDNLDFDNVGSKFNDFFEVDDIVSNVDGSENWICGFSVFFLKSIFLESDADRLSLDSCSKLIRGVRRLIEFNDRSNTTVLRFYVSDEVFNMIWEEGLLNSDHTEFYKMCFPSEDTQIGTMWRLMVLSDDKYEYAIETDVSPDEDWILPRIADWGHVDFLKWLDSGCFLAGETFFPNYFTHPVFMLEDITKCFFCPEVFDNITAGGILSKPSEMPDMKSVFVRYMEMNPSVYLHDIERSVWTEMRIRHAIAYGWQGWGPDQSIWRLLKRVIPTTHIVWGKSLENLITHNRFHYIYRFIKQLVSDGHYFIDSSDW